MDERLHKLLVRAGDDGRARAEIDAWPIIEAAFAAERPKPRPAYRSRAVLATAAIAAAIVLAVVAVSSPGAAVAHWLRDHIIGTPGVKHSAPALTRLPGGGRMLVSSRQGLWVVQGDGSRRLLRGYAGATWSPHGLYVGAWRGHQLVALEPNGRIHWSLARSGRIAAAAWSPDGFRIAYLSGHGLRVVAGDGTGDAQLRRRVAAVSPTWKPRGPHQLLVAPRARVVDLVATDAKALVWRRHVSQPIESFAWSEDGALAAVGSASRVTVLDGASGRVRNVVRTPAGFRIGAIAFGHHTHTVAITLRSRTGRARVVTVSALDPRAGTRQLFAGAGSFPQVQWSPDDRWLLISWPAANQWLFVRSSRVNAIRAVSNIASEFDPGGRAPRSPGLGGWCCTSVR